MSAVPGHHQWRIWWIDHERLHGRVSPEIAVQSERCGVLFRTGDKRQSAERPGRDCLMSFGLERLWGGATSDCSPSSCVLSFAPEPSAPEWWPEAETIDKDHIQVWRRISTGSICHHFSLHSAAGIEHCPRRVLLALFLKTKSSSAYLVVVVL